MVLFISNSSSNGRPRNLTAKILNARNEFQGRSPKRLTGWAICRQQGRDEATRFNRILYREIRCYA